MSRERPVRVLILGQTPPPTGGQSVMIAALVSSRLDGLELRHVRMAYSKDILENGRFRAGKVLHLASVIGRTWLQLVRFRPDVVYYPPGGPGRVPMARDIVTLLAIRPFARKIVFHFHAGGVSAIWQRGIRSRTMTALYRRAFFGADASIQLSPINPPDGQVLQARRIAYVANGVADVAKRAPDVAGEPVAPRVLYVGVVIEPKGIVDLVTASAELWRSGVDFFVDVVGDYSPEMAGRLRALAGEFADRVSLHGVLDGEAKWDRYRQASIFCMPTFFEAEGAPLVIIEAMMFGLPVLSTTWRSVPDLVTDGKTGLLVSPHDAQGLAGALQSLLVDSGWRHELGMSGRWAFEERFSLESHLAALRDVLLDVGRT